MHQITFFLIFSLFTMEENEKYHGQLSAMDSHSQSEGVMEAREYLSPKGDTMLYRILLPAVYKSGLRKMEERSV